MGLFGKSKEDSSEDKQIENIWKWIEALNKNQQILVKNNNAFIQNEKDQRQFYLIINVGLRFKLASC